jgi:S-adenosyl methyltransferase
MVGGLEPEAASVSVDTSVPHIARVYDYWLGGKDNFAVDRAAAEQVMQTFPDILVSVRAQRAFLGRAGRSWPRRAGTLDFGQPVAVMLLGVLHCIPDKDDPAAIVARLVDAVTPGSYLTIAHPASDVATDQMATSMRNYNEHVTVPLTARSHDEVSAFFAGLDLVEPGLVQLHRWRAGTGDPGNGRELANYGGVGRKP